MDEYALEIASLRRTLARLRADEAEQRVIDEYEAELRNLSALYAAALETMVEGERDPGLTAALTSLGFGSWKLANVYGFVYEASMDADTDDRELAAVVSEIDFAASLRAAAAED